MVGRFFAKLGSVVGSLVGMLVLAVVAGAIVAAACLPAVGALKLGVNVAQDQLKPTSTNAQNIIPLAQKTTIYAKKGGKNVALASFYAQDRIVLKWPQLSKTVINATLAAEDIRYYEHGGIDPQSLVRAASKQGSSGAGGGSTIAMQYVKNVCVQQAELLPTQKEVSAEYKKCVEVSYSRKLSDIRNAIALNKKYSKDDILLAYLNIVGFGGRVYGIEAASRYYFGVHSDKLTASQAASLIAIVNNPGVLKLDNPKNLTRNKERRDYILNRMYTHNMLSKADYDKAVKSKVKPKITPANTGCMAAGVAGFFCDYVENELMTDPTFGATPEARYSNLQTAGWKVYTTLNLDLQKSAQKTMSRYVPPTNPSFRIGGSAVSMQVGTGRILAMVQNKKYNNTADTKKSETSVNYSASYNSGGFQPGSTYKLFTLLDWIKSGHGIYETVNGNARTLPASQFTQCGGPYYGSPWTFGNDEPGEGGYQSVQHGTQGSVNGVFASMATQLDLCDIRDLAQSFGVTQTNGAPMLDNPPSVIGGASGTSPLQMTAAYSTVANDGVYCKPIAIDSIKDASGKSLPVPQADCTRVLTSDIIDQAKTALHTVITAGTAAGDAPNGNPAGFIAKTGTTDNAVQTWMMGSNSKITTGVWVGNVSGQTSLRAIGSTPFCGLKGSSQAAIERHCVWHDIETKALSLYK
jgi:membrane peptidoglycan carboxypeptidase